MPVVESSGSSHKFTDPSRLSLWTVVGAVCASVITAGVLGGASGILQIPTMSSDIVTLRASRESTGATLAAISERLRSQELVTDGLQRQANALTGRIDAITARQDKKDSDDRNSDIQTQRDIAALEGRSKDRNTEALGVVNALRSEVNSLTDRQHAAADALAALRQNVYDLATRIYRQGNQQSLPLPLEPGSRSYQGPSVDRNSVNRNITPVPQFNVNKVVR